MKLLELQLDSCWLIPAPDALAAFGMKASACSSPFPGIENQDLTPCVPALAVCGRLVLCAGSLSQILGSLIRTIGTSHRVLAGEAAERPADLATLVALAEAGRYAPPIDRTVPLERVAEAHAYVDTGRKRGSVFVTMC